MWHCTVYDGERNRCTYYRYNDITDITIGFVQCGTEKPPLRLTVFGAVAVRSDRLADLVLGPCIADRERWCGKEPKRGARGQTTRGKVGYVMFVLFANPASTTFGKRFVWANKGKHDRHLPRGALILWLYFLSLPFDALSRVRTAL